MPGDPFYRSKEWLGVRARVLKRDAYHCTTPRCSAAATHVDHDVPRSRGGAALDPRNLRSLCAPCHSRKTARTDGGFGNRSRPPPTPIGADGWPLQEGEGGGSISGRIRPEPCPPLRVQRREIRTGGWMTVEWPADRVERRSIEALVPHARNARSHSDEQVAQIAASIREWGWTIPVLVDEQGGIIAGHGRVLAARKLGIAEVPVMVAVGWTDAQRRAYVIADNKIALNASWDSALLASELADLAGLGFNIGLSGFTADELAGLSPAPAAGGGRTEDDDIPEPEPVPVSRAGDVWILGKHRVMCGDSTSLQDVAALMAGRQADLCFTSPPYAQQRAYKSGGISDWDALMQGVFTALPAKDDAQVLVNLGLVHREGEWLPYWDGWIQWMRGQGWRRFGWYVWDQGPGLPGDWNGRLAPAHEFIFHFNRVAERARKTKPSKWAGHTNHGSGLRAADGSVTAYTAAGKAVQDRKIPDSVVRVMRHKARGIEVEHPAVFPVELVSEMVTAFSDPGDVLFEPFCGSGTQIIAAEKSERECCAMELAPIYVDLAVRRWEAFTGQEAVLARDQRTFSAIAEERRGSLAA